MKQIVCLATSPWHPIPTRKQQVMGRLTDCEILYFDPSISYLAPLKDKSAKAKLRAALIPHRPPQPLQGPVRLVVKWCFADPEGRHRNGEYKTSKPDTDNLEKALKDQMTRLGFWADDAQVASEVAEKFWADVPGVFIFVEAL